MKKLTLNTLHHGIQQLIRQVQNNLYRVVNTTLAETYFHTGRLIIEFEQSGSKRAAYAKETLTKLSVKLIKEFGKGYSVDNLENMRNFYLAYKDDYFQFHKNQKSETVSRKSSSIEKSETASRKSSSPFKLTWSHYLILMHIENLAERKFYEIECYNENWVVRELKRQYDSSLYERLVLSRNKKKVKDLSKKGHIISRPQDAIKDPLVLEFLDLDEKDFYSENDLEEAIISKLEEFLKELGKGFLFVCRQHRFRVDSTDYKIDLVFYQRILRCFVLIDLKMGSLEHKDIGQMQYYVNYYDRKIKDKSENKTIGIILCKDKKESIV
ncbi:MAG TPA: PDDEXK nuclease domain-containing protein, partial [Chitinophagaceae bacterium]|nr:PDDEXK nuclease domain-containing protein [Chitinophagaceae bacterium]